VIRGGAIGDFILTLPALKAQRDAYPEAHLEILGYKHIIALAENRFYAQATRSIESAQLASFFGKRSELSPELVGYFASFDLIVSYLYDPDAIFEANLRRCGIRKFVQGPAKVLPGVHAARQLAQPIENLGIPVHQLAAKLFPSFEDRHCAAQFLTGLTPPLVVFHPGSGSEQKNWPIENWMHLGDELLKTFTGSLLIISGEADSTQIERLESVWNILRVRFAKNLSLPTLAGILSNMIFVGHDSGISHLAAAAGARCILLFGPTDPATWAPLNESVRVLRAPNEDLRKLEIDTVRAAVDQELIRIGIRT